MKLYKEFQMLQNGMNFSGEGRTSEGLHVKIIGNIDFSGSK